MKLKQSAQEKETDLDREKVKRKYVLLSSITSSHIFPGEFPLYFALGSSTTPAHYPHLLMPTSDSALAFALTLKN